MPAASVTISLSKRATFMALTLSEKKSVKRTKRDRAMLFFDDLCRLLLLLLLLFFFLLEPRKSGFTNPRFWLCRAIYKFQLSQTIFVKSRSRDS